MMILEQLIAHAEATERQRKMLYEEEQRAEQRKRDIAVEEARELLIRKLGDLWLELWAYETESRNRLSMAGDDALVVEYGIKFAPPKIAPFWAVLRGNHLRFSIAFNGYAVSQAELGEFLLERRRTYEMCVRQRARDLEVAEQVIAAAREFLGKQDEYDSACRRWAEHWTAALWRPWTAWLVRYVPVFSGPITIQLHSQDQGEIDLSDLFIHEALVLGDEPPSGQTVVSTVTKRGERQELLIGALLDARLVRFDSSNIREHLEYHRTYYAGQFCVNAMPTVDAAPSSPPPAPELWCHMIARIDTQGVSQGLMQRIELLEIEKIALATPEELVDDMVKNDQ
jgi:hypothetical protein